MTVIEFADMPARLTTLDVMIFRLDKAMKERIAAAAEHAGKFEAKANLITKVVVEFAG